MKALTLYQPWATLVAIGEKRIETRSWYTAYRGPLAIHAGKNKQFIDPRKEDCLCGVEPFRRVLDNFNLHDMEWRHGSFPLGAVIATCELVACKQIDKADWLPHQTGWSFGHFTWFATEQEKFFGDYGVGRYMWFLANIQVLPEPISVKGAMGLWEWETV